MISKQLFPVTIGLILTSCLHLTGCGGAVSDLKIIGGEASKAPSYFAALHYEGESVPFCGGSLIAPDVVLTAAHCVSSSPRPIEVWLGVDDLHHLPSSIEVEAIEVHPQYHTQSIQFDLALVRLKSDKRRKRLPISLGDDAAQWEAGVSPVTLRVFGFGSTTRDGLSQPDLLQSTRVDELMPYSCQAIGGPYDSISGSQVCAGDFELGQRDSCYGDSGGPLIAEGTPATLYGIVSWGLGCGRKDKPGVYTRIRSFRTWIEDKSRLSGDGSLTDMVGRVFYFPLLWKERASDQEERVKRFSAANALWKEGFDPELKVVSTWTRSFRGQPLKLDLIEINSSRYRLRLTYKAKVYESSVHFTELSQAR